MYKCQKTRQYHYHSPFELRSKLHWENCGKMLISYYFKSVGIQQCKKYVHIYQIMTMKNLQGEGSVDACRQNVMSFPQMIVESFPVQYHPYLKLSRIDRPIGM